jgi:hypothetical protein
MKKRFPIPFGLGLDPFSFPQLGSASPSSILFNRPNWPTHHAPPGLPWPIMLAHLAFVVGPKPSRSDRATGSQAEFLMNLRNWFRLEIGLREGRLGYE